MTNYDVDISPTGGPAELRGGAAPADAASTSEAATAAKLLPR